MKENHLPYRCCGDKSRLPAESKSHGRVWNMEEYGTWRADCRVIETCCISSKRRHQFILSWLHESSSEVKWNPQTNSLRSGSAQHVRNTSFLLQPYHGLSLEYCKHSLTIVVSIILLQK